MIYHPVIQRSREWYQMRIGIPTASNFHRIITPGGKPSKQAEDYLHTCLAEWIIGHPIDSPETAYMARGTELEDEAIKSYEFQTETETQPGGFWTTDDGLAGASPDRLVGDEGILEIKVPKHNTQVRYLLTGKVEEEYRPQLQGQLWLAGESRSWVDISSYHPELPPVIICVRRDEDYIYSLSSAVGAFVNVMVQYREELERKYGPFVRPQAAPSETDAGSLGITEEDATLIVDSMFPTGQAL